MSSQNAPATFDPLRPRFIRIAYRMLGSVADAEDMVQDAFLRWLDADRDAVREPAAYLRRVVTRLCLDNLKSARHRRETYIGPWLPEPVVEAAEDEIDDVTLPLMMALERLSPLERAAFLLHDVFGVSFEEIAETIGREPATCRQLASRARTHVRAARPRFDMPKERGLQIASAFFAATRNGNMRELQSLLAADVTMHSDGGGKKPAARRPIVGLDVVMQFHASLAWISTARNSANIALASLSLRDSFDSAFCP
jgi:RNA polymerase sigma-70 factor (ECF subfamily)